MCAQYEAIREDENKIFDFVHAACLRRGPGTSSELTKLRELEQSREKRGSGRCREKPATCNLQSLSETGKEKKGEKRERQAEGETPVQCHFREGEPPSLVYLLGLETKRHSSIGFGSKKERESETELL